MDDAASLKLDMAVFRGCRETGKHRPDVQSGLQVASAVFPRAGGGVGIRPGGNLGFLNRG